ncbi:MAG: hypothetical protein COT71_04415 [Candidatus Andersenbacteria bacterium CG10_big_fil_rev_8_21_14_0_10_54_11]|uniref:Regulatory protein RecX n=1 Tax=Candidatus Andersenbacteria bacterium CG10_big_fil_rev_8_21_14_0_10_54_11 TaxID=1974485 RepID=A0A2M6WY81_9BACT|nr:MAG: hypothetical protein COT71_04415 [Candidatus Andersenbacteria bacterium CG10_big_fil_rev_8_21_14_0_10_54_11]
MPQQHLADINYAAQAILARRDHSESELSRKLARKGYSGEEIALVLTKLKKIKLVDDEEFARRYAGSLLAAKPLGPRLLHAKLIQKGIEEGLISSLLAETYPPGREDELSRAAASRWRQSRPTHADDKARLLRFLTARGFSFNSANNAASNAS